MPYPLLMQLMLKPIDLNLWIPVSKTRADIWIEPAIEAVGATAIITFSGSTLQCFAMYSTTLSSGSLLDSMNRTAV
jgi:hypothetical protein